jgi:hypothetical protein
VTATVGDFVTLPKPCVAGSNPAGGTQVTAVTGKWERVPWSGPWSQRTAGQRLLPACRRRGRTDARRPARPGFDGLDTESGGTALIGRAVDTATVVPFRPPAEALLGAYRSGPITDNPDVAPSRGALACLVPDRARQAARADVGAARRRRMPSGGRSGTVAGLGTAVLLDDLHWPIRRPRHKASNLASDTCGRPRCPLAIR